MTYRVLVTARSFGSGASPHLKLLTDHDCEVQFHSAAHPLSAAELGAVIGGFDGAILGLDACDASVIAQADRLRVISRYGAGVDAVDLEAAAVRGIVVTNTPGANSLAVAELAVGLIFALARRLPQVAAAARIGEWQRAQGIEISGRTLGVVGFGAIGREVGRRAVGLGMRVLTHDPYWSGQMPGVESVSLEDLLRESHFVTLHCALTPETESLIDAARIASMRDGAYLINTARGGLVDETALYAALESGKLAGAALDVFRVDPPVGNALLTLPNCIATPHIGATTVESVQRMAMGAAQNLVAVLTGAPCPNIVNRAALERHGIPVAGAS